MLINNILIIVLNVCNVRLLNLMFGKLNKNLFKGWSSDCIVSQNFVIEFHYIHRSENLTQSTNWFNRNIILDLVFKLNDIFSLPLLFELYSIYLIKIIEVFNNIFINFIFKYGFNCDVVSWTVFIFNLAWATNNYKSTINHNSNIVT